MSEVKRLLQDMVDQKIIRRSASPYASPVVLVRKKSGGLRLCIDYRRLNLVTVKDSFPLPRIDESLEAMGGSQFFSSLDLSHGYFQIAMEPDSIPYTAFRVPWGLFEFERMPQGLCNSPSTFQRVMEIIFGDMNLSQLILYLDDILIFSATLEQHLDRLQTVFQRLIQHGLKLKGLASYYRKFVPDFAKLAAPLHSLKKTDTTTTAGNKSCSKQSPLKWNKEADEAFRQLKTLLSSSPVLAYPRFDREFVLEIDASLKGLGCCLLQRDDAGHLHPIAYASRGLRGAEKNYSDFSSFKLELLGLKWAVTACSALPIEVVRNPLPEDNPPEEITRPSIFPSFSFSQLADLQKKDDALSVVWECWTSDWQPGEELRQPCTPEIKSWLREFSKIVERHGVLYREVTDKWAGTSRQLLVPISLRTKIIGDGS
ncbi:putative transposon Ty3-I Gag-Pol polyprotein [Apostichopus japonicus]|uniref:Putative transposon Ty3-I Gag-Pol polyprotein n=1 Tax=Stichopus japonicus TaxID=307972 RepID=A0A2G8JXM9_STIJA|nr:putative transposon Ty3-I Gag-Pol polyprotein [Apostichopus japonicus]